MENTKKLSLEKTADREAMRDIIDGYAYCFAHHLTVDGDEKKLMIAAIKYEDEFIKIKDNWFFKRRDLKVQWIETKLLNI